MHRFAIWVLILTAAAAGASSAEDKSQKTLLNGLNELLDSVHRQFVKHDSTSEDTERLRRVSEVLQSYRFRLENGRIVEKSPREFLDKLVAQVRAASPQEISKEFEDLIKQLLYQTTDSLMLPQASQSGCPETNYFTPAVALNELNIRCTAADGFFDVLGCLSAVTLYCHRMFPEKSDSQLIGLITDRSDNKVSIACLDQGSLILATDYTPFARVKRPDEQQFGADSVCVIHHGQGYAGVYLERMGSKTLGEDVDNIFAAGCFRYAKQVPIPYTTLQSLSNNDCRPGVSVEKYGCLRAASRYCKEFGGYTGGIVQSGNALTATIACYNAFYTGDTYINKDIDYVENRKTLKKICSFEFDVDQGKILNAVPEILNSGTYDNRKSSTPLKEIFSVKRTVSTTNEFTHSHAIHIGMDYTLTVKVPFVETSIKVSASYTATLSFKKTNTISIERSHQSEVLVDPGKGVVKKAVITASTLNVPWRAVGINMLGSRVELSGTWQGVDVSDIKVVQEDL